ncbi:tetratricopeptide repeat protein [Rugosimonospora africana]|uniref:tetratricopeptide repeat protein n=1 Tax=Rugosimonospora africana TaxID=556532 RepID=UPI001EF26114|nr:hypothetical protein [Rugosimonospora africana]
MAAGQLVDDDPETALEHAIAARRLASRIPVVREAVGIAAYHAGQWQTAVAELRTYHRMTGQQTHLAVLADCERALGRPEKAIDIYRSADRGQLDSGEAIELLIVAAGARRDLGQDEAALAMLQVRELGVDAPWAARLRYAYADGLLAADRRDEAREWFARAVEADDEATTDAAERLLELDGVTLDEAEDPDDEYSEEGEYSEDDGDGRGDDRRDGDDVAADRDEDDADEHDDDDAADDDEAEFDDDDVAADRDEDDDADEYDDDDDYEDEDEDEDDDELGYDDERGDRVHPADVSDAIGIDDEDDEDDDEDDDDRDVEDDDDEDRDDRGDDDLDETGGESRERDSRPADRDEVDVDDADVKDLDDEFDTDGAGDRRPGAGGAPGEGTPA